jgi:hypothetical protein
MGKAARDKWNRRVQRLADEERERRRERSIGARRHITGGRFRRSVARIRAFPRMYWSADASTPFWWLPSYFVAQGFAAYVWK